MDICGIGRVGGLESAFNESSVSIRRDYCAKGISRQIFLWDSKMIQFAWFLEYETRKKNDDWFASNSETFRSRYILLIFYVHSFDQCGGIFPLSLKRFCNRSRRQDGPTLPPMHPLHVEIYSFLLFRLHIGDSIDIMLMTNLHHALPQRNHTRLHTYRL